MAKLIIELMDTPDGRVAINWSQSIEELVKKNVSGHELTCAEGYYISIGRMLLEKIKKDADKERKDRMDYMSTDPHRHLLINKNI